MAKKPKRMNIGHRSQTKQPVVSVVTLNFNDEKNTTNCLNSLQKLDYPHCEIIIVDNGSSLDSFNAIKNYIKRSKSKSRFKTKLIRSKQNTGFAEGSNIGVRASKANYIAILGNDSIVDKNWLKEMMEVMKEDKKVVMVGSEVNSVGSFYEKRKTLGAVMTLFGEPMHIKPKDKSFTFLVSGCSMLFRKSIVKEPFDKDYFAYGEDVALSWLVNLKSYKTKMAHKSKLDHLGGVVRKKLPKLVEFHAEKNKLMNLLLFYEPRTLIKIAPLVSLNVLITLIISVPKLRFLTRMKSYFWLIKNYKKLIKKRRSIQKQRRISDNEIFKYITCRSAHTNNFLVNNSLKLYCFIFGLPVLELRK